MFTQRLLSSASWNQKEKSFSAKLCQCLDFGEEFQFVLTMSVRLTLSPNWVRFVSSFSLQETPAACLIRAAPASEYCIRTPAHANTTWRKPDFFSFL